MNEMNKFPVGTKQYRKLVEALKIGYLDIFTLANNEFDEMDEVQIIETIKRYRKALEIPSCYARDCQLRRKLKLCKCGCTDLKLEWEKPYILYVDDYIRFGVFDDFIKDCEDELNELGYDVNNKSEAYWEEKLKEYFTISTEQYLRKMNYKK